MKNQHVRPMVHTKLKPPVREVKAAGKQTTFKYVDEVKLDRRRALAGRPAGTECNACTCS